MRYYSIKITNPESGEVVRPRSLSALQLTDTYSSYVNGRTLPGALNVELNIPLYNYATPLQGSFVRVWGVSIEELGQANNLAKHNIVIKAGMQKGLPLAKPGQAGVIVVGTIFQAFGNMIGTDRTLDMIILPPTGVGGVPLNFSFIWPKDTPLSSAIRATLQVALPGYEIKMSISADLKMSSEQTGIYTKLSDFATAIQRLTRQKLFAGFQTLSGISYKGVEITIKERTVLVYDGTEDYSKNSYSNPIKIAFEDMIGQPTWITATSINFKTVMRADISVADYIKMPEKLNSPYVLTVPGAAFPGTPARSDSAFKGVFVVQKAHHFGNFRQADAASWVTSYDAVFVPPSAATIEANNQAKINAAFNAPS